MRLLTIDCREVGGRPGVMLSDNEIIDLAAAPSTLTQSQWIPYSVVSILAAGHDGRQRIEALRAAIRALDTDETESLRSAGALLPLRGTALLPPVRRPGLVLIAEADGRHIIKNPNTVVGQANDIEVPWHDGDALTCTGMLAAVIGRPLFNVGAKEAGAAIAGYTLVADFSCDGTGDRQQNIESRQFPGATPLGPTIVTVDEFGDPAAEPLKLALNDVEVAVDSAGIDAGAAAERVGSISRRYGLRPGDLICFEPPDGHALHARQVRRGDRLRLSHRSVPGLEAHIL